jgi:O-antigen/teichoic acid export membrane protein
MTVAQSVARNSLVQLAGRGVTMAVSLATLTLLSRYLGPYRFGQYQLVIAFLTLVNVSDFGVATIAVRHLSTSGHDPDELMGNVLTIRTALAFISSALAIALVYAIGYPDEIKYSMALASLSFPLMIATGAYNATFAANLRMEFAALGNIAQAVVTLTGMLIAVHAHASLVGLLLAYDLGILANSIVCLHFARRFVRPRFRWDFAYGRSVMREALPLGLAVLVITVYGRIDIVLLKAFTTSESVGYYGLAYRVVDLAFPLSFFFVGSVYPLLSSYHNMGEHAEFKRLYQRSHDVLSLVGMSIVTGGILFAKPITEVIGGSQYGAAVTSLQVLSMAVALIWLSNLVDHGLIAVGKQGALLWIACIGLVVNVGVNLVLIPLYGKEGAAAATVITEAAVLVPALFLLSRYMGEAPSFWVSGRLLPIAGIAGIVIYALPLPWISEVILAMVVFSLGVALVRVVSLDDIRALLRRHDAGEVIARPAAAEAGTGR